MMIQNAIANATKSNQATGASKSQSGDFENTLSAGATAKAGTVKTLKAVTNSSAVSAKAAPVRNTAMTPVESIKIYGRGTLEQLRTRISGQFTYKVK